MRAALPMWRRRALHGLWGQPGRFIHRSARTRMLRFFSSGAIDKLIRRIGILAKYTTAAESSALSGRTASVQVFRKRCLLPETSVFALEADAGDQANAAAIRQPTPGCSFRSSPMPSSHVWPFRNPKSSRPRARHSRQTQRKRRGSGFDQAQTNGSLWAGCRSIQNDVADTGQRHPASSHPRQQSDSRFAHW
jgi:hypothetical protein